MQLHFDTMDNENRFKAQLNYLFVNKMYKLINSHVSILLNQIFVKNTHIVCLHYIISSVRNNQVFLKNILSCPSVPKPSHQVLIGACEKLI